MFWGLLKGLSAIRNKRISKQINEKNETTCNNNIKKLKKKR